VSSTRRSSYLLLSALTCAFAVGYLQAKGVTALFGERRDTQATRGEPSSQFARGGEPMRSARAVLARNPFDSVTGPLLPPQAPDSRTISLGLGSRIHRLGPTQFIVERSAFDEMLNAMPELSPGPPIVPISKNGKVIGVQVFGVRPDTVLGALGLENGDMLHSLNGYDLTDPVACLNAWPRLIHAKAWSLTVTRGGGKATLEYAIQSAAPVARATE
jgi:general secretion pathway protein C